MHIVSVRTFFYKSHKSEFSVKFATDRHKFLFFVIKKNAFNLCSKSQQSNKTKSNMNTEQKEQLTTTVKPKRKLAILQDEESTSTEIEQHFDAQEEEEDDDEAENEGAGEEEEDDDKDTVDVKEQCGPCASSAPVSISLMGGTADKPIIVEEVDEPQKKKRKVLLVIRGEDLGDTSMQLIDEDNFPYTAKQIQAIVASANHHNHPVADKGHLFDKFVKQTDKWNKQGKTVYDSNDDDIGKLCFANEEIAACYLMQDWH